MNSVMIFFITSILTPLVISLLATYLLNYFWKRPILRIDSYKVLPYVLPYKDNHIPIHLRIKNQGEAPLLRYWIIGNQKILERGFFVENKTMIEPTIKLDLFRGENAEILGTGANIITIVYKDNFPIPNYYKTVQSIDCVYLKGGAFNAPIDKSLSKRMPSWSWFFDENMRIIKGRQ